MTGLKQYTDAQKAMIQICDEMAQFLVEKNIAYGNSAFTDVTLGGTVISAELGIKVRIIDKIKRLLDGKEYGSEDTYKDLLGYLIILLANRKLKNKEI